MRRKYQLGLQKLFYLQSKECAHKNTQTRTRTRIDFFSVISSSFTLTYHIFFDFWYSFSDHKLIIKVLFSLHFTLAQTLGQRFLLCFFICELAFQYKDDRLILTLIVFLLSIDHKHTHPIDFIRVLWLKIWISSLFNFFLSMKETEVYVGCLIIWG